MTTRYNKGRAFEWEARKLLEQAGWLVIRSAGSKTPFDLAAFGGFGTRLIQVKGDKVRPTAKQLEVLAGFADRLPPSVCIELWTRMGPKKFDIRTFRARRGGVPHGQEGT